MHVVKKQHPSPILCQQVSQQLHIFVQHLLQHSEQHWEQKQTVLNHWYIWHFSVHFLLKKESKVQTVQIGNDTQGILLIIPLLICNLLNRLILVLAYGQMQLSQLLVPFLFAFFFHILFILCLGSPMGEQIHHYFPILVSLEHSSQAKNFFYQWHFIFNEMAMPTFTGGESVSQKTKTGMFTCDDSSMTIAYVLESKTPRSIGSKHFLGNCRVPGAHFHASSFTPLH
eukprot:TRINITY_DN3508_c0_g1_i2.p1 TRINITY_DN3508_c0_g1~~TRINITY_DN3508_c0_g1_i2.p1  ORF type:complete len:227 (-),score=-6.90 TRINITY_DN3508_c0_g1_i2:460-1140(-)